MNMPAGGGGQPMEHDMSSMPGMSMDGQMAGHGAGGTSLAPGNAPAPAAPSDHYADRIYQNGAMVDSRSMLHNEHGASTSSSSEERRVGGECVITCRLRGLAAHNKKKKTV